MSEQVNDEDAPVALVAYHGGSRGQRYQLTHMSGGELSETPGVIMGLAGEELRRLMDDIGAELARREAAS